jgi:excisionase family DNA binding protein
MKHDKEPAAKLLLTVTEAAARLGIGRTFMYELISTGAIPSVRVGRLRRIRTTDLEAYAVALEASPADRSEPAA